MESSLQLLENYGLDGLDVDYEYPSNDEQAQGYVELLRELRAALDRHAQKKGPTCRFLLSVSLSLYLPCHIPQTVRRLLLPVDQITIGNYM